MHMAGVPSAVSTGGLTSCKRTGWKLLCLDCGSGGEDKPRQIRKTFATERVNSGVKKLFTNFHLFSLLMAVLVMGWYQGLGLGVVR